MSLSGDLRINAYNASDIAGRYAFRFSGFNNTNPDPMYLGGLGSFDLRSTSPAAGEISGKQNFAKMLLIGQSPQAEMGVFDIRGEYTLNADGTGSASITFKNDAKQLLGQYKLIVAGAPDRFWLISDGIKQISSNTSEPEVTNIEAVRMTGGSGP